MATETKEVAAPKEPTMESKVTPKVELRSEGGEKGFIPMWPGQALSDMTRFLEGLFVREFPAVDIIDRDSDILVRAELPGVLKEDLSVSLGDNSLTIKGTAREEKLEKGDYLRREISRRGRFSRTLPLPFEVDAAKGKARLKDCLLELTLPKAAKLHALKIE
jgi:HSP20 family molecular chaperone IbpA